MTHRLKYAAIHFLCSFFVILVLAVVAWWGWYGEPSWYLTGVLPIVGVVILVDTGLGPCATFIVASPNKPWKILRWDLAVILTLQVFALCYAGNTLWRARPVFYVLSGSSVTLIRASDIGQSGIDEALKHGKGKFVPTWRSLPMWVLAPMPDKEEEVAGIIQHAILTGEDISNRPRYFQPIPDAAGFIERYLAPIVDLKNKKVIDEADFNYRLRSLNLGEKELGYLSVAGPDKDGVFVFQKGVATPIDFWPVVAPKGS